MDVNKIPVKYTLGLWKSLPVYPTKMDVLYEIYAWLVKNEKAEFSEQSMNYVFDPNGCVWQGTDKDERFRDLLEDGHVKENRKVGDKVWYVIEENKNPFK